MAHKRYDKRFKKSIFKKEKVFMYKLGQEYRRNSYFQDVNIQKQVFMIILGPKLARFSILTSFFPLMRCPPTNRMVFTYALRLLDNMMEFT